MPCSVTQPEPGVVLGTAILPSPVQPKGLYQVQGITNSFAVSQVMCACLSMTLLQPEELVVCCCTAGKDEQGPVGDYTGLHIVVAAVLNTQGGLLAKDSSGDHICSMFGASIHLLLWERSPLPLALNCFASPLNELCIAGWDGPRPSTVLLGTWMSWPSSPAEACGALSPVQGPLLSSEAAVVGVLAQCLTSPEPARHPSLAEALIRSAAPCALLPWATVPGTQEKRMFSRPERSSQCWMLFWPSFKFMGDFFTIYPPQKKAVFGLSRCCKQHCCENATLCTWYSTENQEPADGEWRNTCSCKTQVVRGARAAHALPSPSCATPRKPFNWCFEEPSLCSLLFWKIASKTCKWILSNGLCGLKGAVCRLPSSFTLLGSDWVWV